MYTCPQNHESDTPDYCSVCGIAIAGSAAPAAPPVAPPAAPSAKCPDCGTMRDTPQQVFCEVCGYNFRSGKSGVPPVAGAAAVPPPEVPKTPPQPAPPATPPAAALAETAASVAAGAPVRWDVTVQVDANLYGTPNADAPTDQPPQTFTLFETETMVGRAGTEVRVHIPIKGDVGVSRRQALLVRRPDGSLVVRDLGSANGTQVNGKDVVAGVDTPVKDGDRIGMGAWTRLTLHAVPA
jgi:hypothetical protein